MPSGNKVREVGSEAVVTLYQIGRGPHIPSLTPFAVKLETYLRAAKIPYTNDHSRKKSSKGKFPSISYNGKQVADSEFCIEFLNKERGVDLNSHLTAEQKGIGRAIQKMVEENTYWVIAVDRWQYDKTNGAADALGVPSLIRCIPRRQVKDMAYKQGMGRHSPAEVEQILRQDLTAVSNYLGTKRFLFGDQVSQYDCPVFGILSCFRYEPFGGISGKIIADFPVVCGYLERMKTTFWPDWEECTTAGGTRKATK